MTVSNRVEPPTSVSHRGFQDPWPSPVAHTMLATMLVAVGSCIRGHLLVGVGLPITLAGFVYAARAAWRVDGDGRIHSGRWLVWGLAAMALTGLFAPVTEGGLGYDVLKRTYFAAALLLVGTWSRLDEPGQRRAMTALCALFAAVHLMGPILVPDPHIDNWAWTQGCLNALLDGIHPYTLTYADIPGAEYGRDPISAYPYPPLTLLVLAPAFVLFGDYRIALAAAMPLTILLLRGFGRRLRLGRAPIDTASLLVLLFPRTFSATCFGHIEPIMALVLTLFGYLAVRDASRFAQGLTFWVMPALKQYCIAPVGLFVGLRKKGSAAAVLTSGLVILATAVPFFAWNGAATWHGLVLEVGEWTAPDPDATSLTALAFRMGWPYPGRTTAAVVQLIVGGLVGWRLRDAGLVGLFLGSAVALLATFLVGWQAYPHYYFLMTVMLALGSLGLAAARSNGKCFAVVEY